ncbi:MAG: glycosyltransferase family 2 protein [Desulfobacula sp.]|uniref:glycosyltransferase family 2 protein n=1 Tax=Desulfobacula sp. TaxID=2593537 RepID=UPI0025BD993F|nr:glycosyltransferase family 2 protein [Desulfobacula sp.]MCD4722092.1 glycosyltransferase family 2 protein [Desulfobacula sp.]
MDRIAIVIPAYNRKAITLMCLDKLNKIKQEKFEVTIVLVDDGSTDGTFQAVHKFHPQVKVLQGDGNLWWTGATNLGVKYALENDLDYILTLNDDVDFENDFLENMLETAKQYPDHIVCCLICYELNRAVILSAGRYRSGFLGYKTPARFHNSLASEVKERHIESELESGYAMLIPQKVFHRVGLFDNKHFPHHMGDMDFVLKAGNAGHKVIVDTKAVLYTSQGKNYLFSFFVENSFKENLKALFNVRSSSFWRTRYRFAMRHTRPVFLAFVSFLYFILRMTALLFIKAFLPKRMVKKLAYKRYGKATYENQ